MLESSERVGAEEFAQLHRNTLDTLALAIDARDQTTHMHLRRVQISAIAVGRELKLSEPELEALNISAMLHDIGKLGIPDHSKICSDSHALRLQGLGL